MSSRRPARARSVRHRRRPRRSPVWPSRRAFGGHPLQVRQRPGLARGPRGRWACCARPARSSRHWRRSIGMALHRRRSSSSRSCPSHGGGRPAPAPAGRTVTWCALRVKGLLKAVGRLPLPPCLERGGASGWTACRSRASVPAKPGTSESVQIWPLQSRASLTDAPATFPSDRRRAQQARLAQATFVEQSPRPSRATGRATRLSNETPKPIFGRSDELLPAGTAGAPRAAPTCRARPGPWRRAAAATRTRRRGGRAAARAPRGRPPCSRGPTFTRCRPGDRSGCRRTSAYGRSREGGRPLAVSVSAVERVDPPTRKLGRIRAKVDQPVIALARIRGSPGGPRACAGDLSDQGHAAPAAPQPREVEDAIRGAAGSAPGERRPAVRRRPDGRREPEVRPVRRRGTACSRANSSSPPSPESATVTRRGREPADEQRRDLRRIGERLIEHLGHLRHRPRAPRRGEDQFGVLGPEVPGDLRERGPPRRYRSSSNPIVKVRTGPGPAARTSGRRPATSRSRPRGRRRPGRRRPCESPTASASRRSR